jgi:hypothetical protein
MKKTKFFLALLCTTCLVFVGCEKTEPTVGGEDLTKFNAQSIVGIWVKVDENNTALSYYDIKSDSHTLYVERDDEDLTQKAVYNPEDGYVHTNNKVVWETYGDFVYSFDEAKQLIYCYSCTWWGYNVKDIKAIFGQNEVFSVSRKGLDEAYLTSLVNDKILYGFIHFTVYDGHVYRIKGFKQDLD